MRRNNNNNNQFRVKPKVKATRGNRANQYKDNVSGIGKTPLYMTPSQITPPKVTKKLTYKSDLTTLSAGATFLAKSFHVNALYDPDPAILTSTYAGYAWLVTAYNQWIVQLNRTNCWVGNNGTVYITAGLVYSFDQLDATITTWQQAKDALEQPFSTKGIQLAPKGSGGSSRDIVSKLCLEDMTKHGEYQSSQLYSGFVASNPAQAINITLVIFSDDGSTNLSNGVVVDLTMQATAEFYGQRTIGDSATLALKAPITDSSGELMTLRVNKTNASYVVGNEMRKLEQK